MPTKDRSSITLDRDLLLSTVYDNLVHPIVLDIFSKAITDEMPNYTIPAWKAKELLDNYNNKFNAMPTETKARLLENLESAIIEYKKKLD